MRRPRTRIEERGIVSRLDRRRPAVRWTMRISSAVVLTVLVLVSGGPLLWLAKSAVSTTQDILRDPFGWWPSGIAWENLSRAWTTIHIDLYLMNTVWVMLGSWFLSLLVALTGAYVISVLRPWYAGILSGAVLATLFIPGAVSLVALYLTVLDVPLLHVNLLNTFWAVWLPHSANAFNVLVLKRFFDSLPREVMEAAEIDGAGPFRVFLMIVLPMSRPIIGVVSLLTVIFAWKDFLWPLLVLPRAEKQPLSVALPRLEEIAETSLLMAGMFIAVVIPVVLFVVFQKQFLHGAGQAGALKG
ncbi:carbohydrate ABC transporter permease [Arachnia propionica]|uniref:Carbohydrate ABC transporter permease n=1 Tax=Arachnia propionica TaxID=1750 RepID=A0A3P1T5V6_9ACTN|nr:carbohydrate ABC transporter permease [Arachnia propionica]RRD04688.1 carbohydrate ABC transporter permease [Arachnia propionica]